MANLQDTDVLPVGRGAATYKATFKDVKDSLPAVADASDTVKGVVELATAAETTTGTDATRAVTPAGLKVELDKKIGDAPDGVAIGNKNYVRQVATVSNGSGGFASSKSWTELPDASETAKGIVELATAAETTTGTDNTRAVHPAGLKVELDKRPLEAPNGTVDGTIQYARQVVTAGAAGGSPTNTKTWAKVEIPPGCHVGETPPATPKQGQQWWHSGEGRLYIYYTDGTSNQWVAATPEAEVDQFWSRSGTKISTKVAGDDISTTGDVSAADATFTGLAKSAGLESSADVKVGGTTAAPNIKLNASGSAVFTGPVVASALKSGSTSGNGEILATYDNAGNAPSLRFKQTGNSAYTLHATDRFYVQQEGGKIPFWALSGADSQIGLGNYTGWGSVSDATVNISESFISNRTPLRIEAKADQSANLTRWTKAGSEVARIDSNGAYFNNSDRRLKENISDLPYGLAEIKQIQPKTFTWKSDTSATPKVVLGVIAQDVQKLIPEIISEGSPDNDGVSYLGIDSTGLIHVLINAVKEMAAHIETLETKVAALEGGIK